MAPTLAGSKRFRDQPLTPASDIYSLAMIFFSLMAGSLPYEGNPELLARAMSRQGRPQIDPSWHKGFMKVGQSCHESRQKRVNGNVECYAGPTLCTSHESWFTTLRTSQQHDERLHASALVPRCLCGSSLKCKTNVSAAQQFR